MNIGRVFALAGAASALLLLIGLTLVANLVETSGYVYPTSSAAASDGTNSSQAPPSAFQESTTSGGPCGPLPVPGVSVISFSNGSEACVAGPPLMVGSDGVADFRNGTRVSLGFTGWYNGLIAGSPYDTVVLENGTRILFDSSGVEVVINPNLGEESFSNGTLLKFPACGISIDAGPTSYPYGLGANGTVWYTMKNGTTVFLYPDGTCGTLTTPNVP
jgi:hypothetical protein